MTRVYQPKFAWLSVQASFLVLLVLGTSIARSDQAKAESTCSEASKQAEKEQTLFSPVSGFKVVGVGRLYFYSAPDKNCRTKDVFVVPGDEVTGYEEFKRWFDVVYTNPRTGTEYEGWVDSKRLKFVGTEQPREQ